jgi:hypothetical protein
MKKKLYLILLALAVLFFHVPPAYAAAERSLTLVSIMFVQGKGVVFTFAPQGEFKVSELSGYAKINYQTFPLSCHFNDENQVKCEADRGLSRFIGQVATGQVAGFSFSDVIRASHSGYCYDVFKKSNGVWDSIATVCGEVPAQDGDWILIGSELAFFNSNGPAGPGFYVGSGRAAQSRRYGRANPSGYVAGLLSRYGDQFEWPGQP